MTLPAVLLLNNDDACILQEIDQNTDEAILIFPDSGMKRIAMATLEEQYTRYRYIFKFRISFY